MLLKIGEFARIGQVPVKTLRYYDEIGLLKPAEVDRFTDYRFYSLDQLARLNRILALKDLGLSLEQISHLLTDTLSTEEIRGMLRLRQAQLADQLQGLNAQQARVEARLRHLEQEDKMPDYDVVLKVIPPMLVASHRMVISEDSVSAMTDAFQQVYRYVEAGQAKTAGPGLSIWHTAPYTEVDQDAEAAVPIDRHLPGNDQVSVYELPKVYVAAVIHHGIWDDFGQAYQAVIRWIDANGYRTAGPFREIYHEYHNDNTEASTTEIQFPVEKQ
jgi:DNA-binding transcriptional MerR regulator